MQKDTRSYIQQTVISTKTITGKTSGKTKKLKSNTYYVKVRAFSTDYEGNKVYGEFSEVKTVIVK